MHSLRLKLPLRRAPWTIAVLLLAPIAQAAPAPAAPSGQAAIHQVLDKQVADWNRGDIVAFMQGYNNAPDTTFVGSTIQHGYTNVLARYRKTFGSREKMGTLSFTGLEIMPVDPRVAVATGYYHLKRSAAGGGDAQGIFSLVLKRTPAGWKIVLDHTS